MAQKCFLNADSKLAVYKDFNEQTRTVKLIGEGFFEVAKNPEKPFLVETAGVKTRVVGTAFNLTAYPENQHVEINVTEGIVEFKGNTGEIRLTANKAAVFDKSTKAIELTEFDASDVQWQRGGVVFKNKPLKEILPVLERKFDVKIINKSDSGHVKMTEIIESNEKIEAVLNRLAQSANLELETAHKTFVFKNK